MFVEHADSMNLDEFEFGAFPFPIAKYSRLYFPKIPSDYGSLNGDEMVDRPMDERTNGRTDGQTDQKKL